MTDTSIKAVYFIGSSPGGLAASGNIPVAYSTWQVNGRIIGVEVGSPAWSAATGSLYVLASGTSWNQNRTIATINGIGQARTYYPLKEFSRSTNQGTLLSGIAYSDADYPVIAGDAIGIAGSGMFGGPAVKIAVYYV
jgi:hypothetical protein